MTRTRARHRGDAAARPRRARLGRRRQDDLHDPRRRLRPRRRHEPVRRDGLRRSTAGTPPQILAPLLHRHRARHDRPEPRRCASSCVAETSLGADQRRAPGGLAQARPGDDLHGQAPRADPGRPAAAAASGWRRSRAPLQVAGRRRRDHARRRTALPRRARVRARRVFSGLTSINAVALDDYLQGVVPAESPASWPAEALQGAGDRRPHVRDHDGQERRLRPVRRHALAGLRRRRGRDGRRPTRRSPTRAGRSSPTRASRSSPTSSRPPAAGPRTSRTRRWAPSRSRG